MKVNITNWLNKKFFFLLFLCFGFCFNNFSLAQEYHSFKPFKMVFLPDTHLSFEKNDDWILYNESLVIFQDTIKTLNKVADINFVVLGGDLTDNKDKKLTDLPVFLDSLYELKYKTYVILGDRDADLDLEYTKEDFCSEFRQNGFLEKNKSYWVTEPVKDILLIGLDTSIQNDFSGKITEEELLWLQTVLESNKDKFTIIAMHHSPITFTEKDNDSQWKTFVIENSSDFINLINKYPQVKLVLSGHHHLNTIKNINNKLFVSTPSIVTYPNESKILTVYPDKVEIQTLKIGFKQIIKKSKKLITQSNYAKPFNKPVELIQIQEGDKFSRQKTYYFNKDR